MAEKKEGFSKYMGLTFLIGFGFFTMGLMDMLYDTFLPDFLKQKLDYMWQVSLSMALDNILAIFLIPVVSVWSDRTRTRMGRRMPWVLVLLPVSALLFSTIPYAVATLWGLLALVFVYNIVKQGVRGPIIALMPDLVPSDYRSEANGVINTMGGIAAIVATLMLGPLMDLDKTLPLLGATKDRLPFPIAGAMVIVALLLLLFFIRENKMSAAAGHDPEEKPAPFFESWKKVRKDGSSTLRILVSILLWFLGYQGVLIYLGVYAKDVLGVKDGMMGFGAGAVAIAYAIAAIPSGFVAHRLGRKRVIRFSLAALVAICCILFGFDRAYRAGAFGAPYAGEAAFQTSIAAAAPDGQRPEGNAADEAVAAAKAAAEGLPRNGFTLPYIIFLLILFSFGAFWVAIVTNSFPMLWQMARQDSVGIYTGLYYTFSQLAAILGPLVAGVIIDVIRAASAPGLGAKMVPASIGYPGIFVYAALCMGAAFLVMRGVKHGEANSAESA